MTVVMVGGTGVMVTTALSDARTVLPRMSVAVTVAMSVWEAPAGPRKSPGKWQV